MSTLFAFGPRGAQSQQQHNAIGRKARETSRQDNGRPTKLCSLLGRFTRQQAGIHAWGSGVFTFLCHAWVWDGIPSVIENCNSIDGFVADFWEGLIESLCDQGGINSRSDQQVKLTWPDHSTSSWQTSTIF
jgi:hypothetical protein